MDYFRQLFQHNREFIVKEILEVKGLMHLLMKNKDAEERWTKDEKKEIRLHLKNISKAVPAMTVFLLPGGLFLLPFLVEILEKKEG
jgi:hypothetical protein